MTALPMTHTTAATPPVPRNIPVTLDLDGKVCADAIVTDPQAMGWMQGEPVPPDKRIAFADGSNYRFPQFRWAFAHARQLAPTLAVRRADHGAVAFSRALDASLWRVPFQSMVGEASLEWSDLLAATYTDALMVMHRGRVVLEHYAGVMNAQRQHVTMSVSKSVVGLVAATLMHQGEIHEDAAVEHYLPEMAGSGFAGATVRQVLDMTTGINYSENYADPQASIWSHTYAGNILPRPANYAGPDSFMAYMPTVQALGLHGKEFTYRTVNSDVLGWIVRRVTGLSLADVVSQMLWQPMGAEDEACYTIDSCAIEFAGGGLNATLRDMARLGELIRQGGSFAGQQIIPESVIADLHMGADPAQFMANGPRTLRGWSYRNMWWVSHQASQAIMARGIHGQNIYIDPRAEMVIARFASHPVAANMVNDVYTLPAYAAMADHLRRV